ncbi:MAG: FixJ family two-component response regulator/anti-sigma regulatory factor (Ser/Thr protein kinase) [Limisphaerales bacterium]|jgi:FixJ family two-component response regulator/anti-sigma regulatory factor (Ser/Thr protein kinase)
MATTITTRERRHVLIVDDDNVCRAMLVRGLKKLGYRTTGVGSVKDAREVLDSPAAETIECVVSDYRMPDENGVDLLRWISGFDPTLSTIMLTSEGDKGSVAEMLREGAIDYLDKPVNFPELTQSVESALSRTRKRRELRETVTAVDRISETINQMIGIRQLSDLPQIEVCYRPMYQAGGDFVNYYNLPDGCQLVLFTDVSGHDLNAAYVSSFFQGMVRGMIEKQAPISEILDFFNTFLMNEWNTDDDSRAGQDYVSLAVCAALVDPRDQTITLTNFGCPPPVYVNAEGKVHGGTDCGSPLGWFHEQAGVSERFSFADGGYLFFWSDGLDDLALHQGVSPYALSFRLLHSDESEREQLLAAAKDDILVLRLDLEQRREARAGPQPVLHELCRGDQHSRIDDLQAEWQLTLGFAMPGISSNRIFDALLCTREAMLNAMEHGCQGAEAQTCELTVLYWPEENRMQVRVEDSGEGFSMPETDASSPFQENGQPDVHCGMILMREVPDRVETARKGSLVRMDFDLRGEIPEYRSQPKAPVADN